MADLNRTDFNVNAGNYEALISNNIATMGDRSTWRHMLSVVLVGPSEPQRRCHRGGGDDSGRRERADGEGGASKLLGMNTHRAARLDLFIRLPVARSLPCVLSRIHRPTELSSAPRAQVVYVPNVCGTSRRPQVHLRVQHRRYLHSQLHVAHRWTQEQG